MIFACFGHYLINVYVIYIYLYSLVALRSPWREFHNKLKCVKNWVNMNEISCLKVRHLKHKKWKRESILHRPKHKVKACLYRSLGIDLRNDLLVLHQHLCARAGSAYFWAKIGSKLLNSCTTCWHECNSESSRINFLLQISFPILISFQNVYPFIFGTDLNFENKLYRTVLNKSKISKSVYIYLLFCLGE